MKFVADIHLHSHFSRATSKNLNLEYLSKWAQLKGVQVVGTGDIAHPGWLEEMKKKLEPAEEGLFKLREEYASSIQKEVHKACHGMVRFMLAGEISNIYKKNDRVRKIHNVVFMPSFEAVERFQARLDKIGNIRSDGRPILGIDARDLFEIALESHSPAHLIPAHIWTPWFSLLGSKSGFDSVAECFEDLTPHLFAMETGLSSDPPMNWRLSALDRYTLVSNSDAHSPQKLAREANVFDTELSYPAVFEALQTGNPEQFLGTVEFFPEEGKYHYDGHRKCAVCWDPKTTLEHDGVCSECGKPVVVGVMHRVEMLADREEGGKPVRTHPFQSLVPLPEVLSEVLGVGVNSKKVQAQYEWLLSKLGPELRILQDLPLEEIAHTSSALLAEALRRMRSGEVHTEAGYDGEYGVIRLFEPAEREEFQRQLRFFPAAEGKKERSQAPPAASKVSDQKEAEVYGVAKAPQESLKQPTSQAQVSERPSPGPREDAGGNAWRSGLNPQQLQAVQCTESSLIILAGPGTGKTRTLTHRIAYLVSEKHVSPECILAVTFTNKAAEEMSTRLNKLLGSQVADRITIKTFHAFGALILRSEAESLGISPNFVICSEPDRRSLLKRSCPELQERQLNDCLANISTAKNQLLTPDSPEFAQHFSTDPAFTNRFRDYDRLLRENQTLDFDDLILLTVKLFEEHAEIRSRYQNRFRWISVDEYQDINSAQYRLLRLLAGGDANLCVIGDPDQAIYGFRGADRRYFLKFRQDYLDAKPVQLSKNYRSTQNILDACGQVIARNRDSKNVEIWSEIVSKAKLDIYQAPTHKAEAEYVVHQIEKMVGGTSYFSLDSGRVDSEAESATSRSLSDFAVLYRLGAQSKALVEAFHRSGIPFQTAGDTPFFEHKEVRRLLAFLWFAYNPDSISHLENILNSKQLSFKADTLNKLAAIARKSGVGCWQVLQQLGDLDFLDVAQKKTLKEMVPFLVQLRSASETDSVSELIERIGAHACDEPATEKHAENSELLKKLICRAVPYENRLGDFLEATVLRKETDDYDPRADRVALMTLHASKGLEFHVVFIVGCEQNLIPLHRKGESTDLEEERRLFYVGMTRARERLILTHARSRFLFGERYQNAPSPFLSDIEDALKEF
ncbi:MAG: UvrD-helicase domain-containing protein, partial [bacterium]